MPREMFQAVCSKCSKNCQVPFKPSPDRPTYCNDCFKIMRQNQGPRPPQGGGQPRNQTNYDVQFRMLNEKLDKLLGILTTTPAKGSEQSRTVKAANHSTPRPERVAQDKKKATKKKVAKKKK